MVVSFYRGERGRGFSYAGEVNSVQHLVITTRDKITNKRETVIVYGDKEGIEVSYPAEKIEHGPRRGREQKLRILRNLYAGLCESAQEEKYVWRDISQEQGEVVLIKDKILVSADILQKIGEVLDEETKFEPIEIKVPGTVVD